MDENEGGDLAEDTDPVRIEVRDLVVAGAKIARICAYGGTPDNILDVLAALAAIPRDYYRELVIAELQNVNDDGG